MTPNDPAPDDQLDPASLAELRRLRARGRARDQVRRDDWHPDPDSGFFELDLVATVESRRHWHATSRNRGGSDDRPRRPITSSRGSGRRAGEPRDVLRDLPWPGIRRRTPIAPAEL